MTPQEAIKQLNILNACLAFDYPSKELLWREALSMAIEALVEKSKEE